VARQIVASWRRLITEAGVEAEAAPTLVACSGGADSTALAIALASTGVDLTLAFARHGARPEEEVSADAAIVERLARELGSPFVSLDCRGVDGDAATEAAMRRARYLALADAARQRSIRFVATGHHADDQLETVLLALIRGAGPTGLAAMRPSRPIDDREPAVHLLRPMLEVTRNEAEELCLQCGLKPPGGSGLSWATDRTNADAAFLRNRLRRDVVPLLEAMSPGLARRVATNSEWFRQTASVLRQQAESLGDQARREACVGEVLWSRAVLRGALPVVIGEVLRHAVETQFTRKGLDRLSGAMLRDITRAVRDHSTQPRRFEPGDGLSIEVQANTVRMTRKSPA
jgi:tRNA(Ile)-lysidine synthase